MLTLSLTFPKLTVSRHGKAADLLIGVGRRTKDFFAIFFPTKSPVFQASRDNEAERNNGETAEHFKATQNSF